MFKYRNYQKVTKPNIIYQSVDICKEKASKFENKRL